MKISGFALLVLGIVALVYGGIHYSQQKKVIDLGPIQATATEQKNIPFSPIVGAIAILGGILLLATPRRRLAGAK
jgi:hypothetical protein